MASSTRHLTVVFLVWFTITGGKHAVGEGHQAISSRAMGDDLAMVRKHQTGATVEGDDLEVGLNAVAKQKERNSETSENRLLG
jgi:hypothetical protein